MGELSNAYEQQNGDALNVFSFRQYQRTLCEILIHEQLF